jgi:AraC-like DNA-binding protein
MKERLSSLAAHLPDEKDNPWPYRVVFGLDLADPPVDSFQVPFPRIEFVLSGSFRNTICDVFARIVDFQLGRGDCLFIGANRWNRPVWSKDTTVVSLLFGSRHLGLSLMTWSAAAEAFTHVEKRNCQIPANSPLYQMLNALAGFQSEEQGISFYCRMLARSIIEYSFQLLEQPARQEESQTSQLYHNVCDYMQQNYEKPLSRDSVAEHFGVSPNYLSRVFREYGSSTIPEYITNVRIERSKHMLQNYSFHLDEIAMRCGFRDVNYFCRVFKRTVGRTPTEFRASGRAEYKRATAV